MSGACFANGWAGKPTEQPGLAEYWTEVNGICSRKDSFFGGDPILPESAGWGIVLGFGMFFSLFTTFLVWLDQRYVGTNVSSEFFNTAGRTVKTGLTASVIVSQWTWAATLLQSSNVAYAYGVSGPFWYASGATIQVLLFGILAIEVKRKAYTAHTICEIIDARWGPTCHKVFLYFCFSTNIIVSSMLILGGAATVNALTGMDEKIAGFLIPMGVIFYTAAGGLKATFMASYLHTAIIFVVLCLFVFGVYAGFDDLGSADAVYDALKAVAAKDRCCATAGDTTCSSGMYISVNDDQACGTVTDNNGGSYLTMLSRGGTIFGIINIIGNFGTVFVDQSYWQSAIAAKPSSSHKGYLLGGLVWFTIPFSLATALGLATVALDLPITASEAGAGLVPPAAAVHFLGKGGASLITVMLFMAIVSTGSAEQIAVSSLVAYDIYRKYFNPEATGEQILKVSRIVIVAFGIFMGVLSIILQEIGLSLGFVYLMMGIFIGSAVVPVSYVLTWSKANSMGAICGAFSGQVMAVIAWVVTAHLKYDEVSVDTLGQNDPMLVGNLFAILGSGLVHTVMSLASPQNYDFSTMAGAIALVDDNLPDLDESENDPKALEHAKTWISKWGFGFTIIMVVFWPALSLPAGVFSRGYFTMWVAIAVTWGIVATIVIVLLPLWESRATIFAVLTGMLTNDDVHHRLDDIEKKLDALLGDRVPDDKPGKSMDPLYRSKLMARTEDAEKAAAVEVAKNVA